MMPPDILRHYAVRAASSRHLHCPRPSLPTGYAIAVLMKHAAIAHRYLPPCDYIASPVTRDGHYAIIDIFISIISLRY